MPRNAQYSHAFLFVLIRGRQGDETACGNARNSNGSLIESVFLGSTPQRRGQSVDKHQTRPLDTHTLLQKP